MLVCCCPREEIIDDEDNVIITDKVDNDGYDENTTNKHVLRTTTRQQ